MREPGIHELGHDEHSVPEPLDEFGRSLPPGAWPCPERCDDIAPGLLMRTGIAEALERGQPSWNGRGVRSGLWRIAREASRGPIPPGQRGVGWCARANCSTIAAQKAGRSAGLRLVTSCPSTTTSWSTTSAPALRRSVRMLGQDVRRRPRTASASTRVHGPWQSDATGFPLAMKSLTNCTASRSIRNWSGFMVPPGRSRAW